LGVALPTQLHPIDAGTEMVGGSGGWCNVKPTQEFTELFPFRIAVRRIAEQCEVRDPKGRFERLRWPRMHFFRQFDTQRMLRGQRCSLMRLGCGAHGCMVCQRTEVIRIPRYLSELTDVHSLQGDGRLSLATKLITLIGRRVRC